MSLDQKYQLKDYKTDVQPVWCRGCGDFGVLRALYQALVELQLDPSETVVISGIGCSSRLPGYVNTYGFNSIHGRGLTLATGIKVTRPNLTVIAVGGDGDGLAIGGNHFLHAARRNINITYIMMDNEIYGLTKGQAAPTTPLNDITKSTIYGNTEPTVDPCEFAISTGASWVGRGYSASLAELTRMMTDAIKHNGFAFLDTISPCVTFRGMNKYKELKPMLRSLPEDHDRTSRTAAIAYTRETEVLTTGILYEVKEVTLNERIDNIVKQSTKGEKSPSVRDMLNSFYPDL